MLGYLGSTDNLHLANHVTRHANPTAQTGTNGARRRVQALNLIPTSHLNWQSANKSHYRDRFMISMAKIEGPFVGKI
jgi:hypothetical protein